MILRHQRCPLLMVLLIVALRASIMPVAAESVEQINRSAAPSGGEVLRFGFSGKVFADINEADGLAAVKVWSESFAESNEMILDVECRIFSKFDDLERALVEGQVDLINITVGEFQSLRPLLDTDKILLSAFGGEVSTEYLLLVKNDSPAEGLEDLKKVNLLALDSLQTSIAPHWLESCLCELGLPRVEEYFGHVALLPKASQVILPVFFGKSDACLVSCRAYETAIELNPQIGSALRIVCRSPQLIPGACFFRASYQSAYKNQVIDSIEKLNTLPRGKQVLLLFKTDRILVSSADDLESTLSVIENGCSAVNP